MSTARRVKPINHAPFERGDHVEIAERLVSTLRAERPVTFTDGSFFGYEPDGGTFQPIPHPRLSQIVQGFAGIATGTKKNPLKLKATDVGGAIRLASDLLADPEFFAKAKRGVAFADCFVEVKPDRIVQLEHSPKHRARFAYSWEYIEAAAPLRLLEFFKQVFRGDDDAKQKIDLLQEYIGVSMLGLATKYQRVLVQVGDGANGKGVLSSIVEQCLPPGSVCAIPPQDLGQEYRRAMLAGKLLNVVSELPEADILDSESWKAIVAGDTTTGREIRKEPFTFKPVAGHIYSANRLPGTTDQSHGFWRRIIVARYNHVIPDAEQDADLADRIVASEAKAIVSWALAGAQRVLGQGRFTVPDSSKAAVDAWKRASDQVRAFVDDWTKPLALDEPVTEGCVAAELYKSYRTWSSENGHRPMASNKFGERMRLLQLQSQHTRTGSYYPVKLAKEWGP